MAVNPPDKKHGGVDTFYVAHGQTVLGFKKKGKKFMEEDTRLNETITRMRIDGDTLFTTGDFLLNTFENLEKIDSVGFFMSSDKINDLEVARLSDDYATVPDPIIATSDRYVRAFRNGRVYCETHLDSAPTALLKFDGSYRTVPDSVDEPERFQQIIYGTENGQIGQLLMDDTEVRRGFTVGNTSGGGFGEDAFTMNVDNIFDRSRIGCFTSADVSEDGIPDIIAGSEDGYVCFILSLWSVCVFSANIFFNFYVFGFNHLLGIAFLETVFFFASTHSHCSSHCYSHCLLLSLSRSISPFPHTSQYIGGVRVRDGINPYSRIFSESRREHHCP